MKSEPDWIEIGTDGLALHWLANGIAPNQT